MRLLNLAEAMQVAEIFNKLDLEFVNKPIGIISYLSDLPLEKISKLLILFGLADANTEPEKIVENLAKHLLKNDIYLIVQSYQKLGF